MENKTNYGKTAKRLMGYVTSTYKWQFVLVVAAIVVSALANTAGPLFMMVLVDDFITPLIGQQTPDFTSMFRAICVLGGVFLAGVLCTYLYSRLMVTIGQGVLKRIRDDMFTHMQKLPVSYFDSHTNGELMSLYTNDIDALRQMISQSIPQAFSAAVTVAAIFITMLILNLSLSIIAIAIVALMVLMTKIIGGKSAKYFTSQQKDLADLNGYVEERMNGQKVIKVFNHEQKSEAEFAVYNESLRNSANQANKYANIMMPVIANLGNLQYVLTAFAGGVMYIAGFGSLTIGLIASFLQFTKSFNQPFSQIAQQFNAIVMALAGAERIFKLMDEQPETDEGNVLLVNARYDEQNVLTETEQRTGIWAWKQEQADGTVTYTEVKGDVRFADMNFGYNEEQIVLHDMSLYAKPGQKIAFVGSTGAGKTTITNLINRFYDIQEGEITYDGINIKEIRKHDLRRSLGIVLQDTHLFSGTIRENIRYGNLTATDEEVEAAAKLANADAFIQMLPEGYDTQLSGDGDGLSQGQCQLLAIARAAIADPPVLILDEATSSIDTRTENMVQEGMDKLMQGRTVFVIAHRLSTIRNSEAIMVLDHGEIIERGDHEKLIEQHGTYYQLYTGALEIA